MNESKKLIMMLAGCVITDQDGRILLLHRNTPRQTHWEIPGGKIESGEDAQTTAIREIQEELGVKARIVRLLGEKEFLADGTRMHYTWFKAEIIDGNPKVMEPNIFDDLSYFSVGGLNELKQSLGLQNFLAVMGGGLNI